MIMVGMFDNRLVRSSINMYCSIQMTSRSVKSVDKHVGSLSKIYNFCTSGKPESMHFIRWFQSGNQNGSRVSNKLVCYRERLDLIVEI